jgi:hypothetical protein
MKIDLLRIFDEYRDAESAQIRRNLCTALAAVGDHDSLKRLVNMAIIDPDQSVRLRAFSELARLEPNRQTAAVAVIVAAAAAEETKGAANYLLAQLQLVGVPISYRPKTIREGIASIQASIAYASRGRTAGDLWGLAGKSLLAAFTASAIGVIFTVAYVQILIGRMSDSQVVIAGSIFLCILLSALMIYFVRPFGGYFVESFLTPIVEVTRVIFLPTFFGVAALCISAVADPDNAETYALALLSVLLLIALVRLCTIFGRIEQSNLNRRQMAQIGFGFCASTLIFTAAVSILNAVGASSAVSWFWLFSLPVILGLAAFFAQIDRSASLARAKEPLGRQIIVFSTFAAFAVLLVVPIFQSLRQPEQNPTSVDVELNTPELKELKVATPANVTVTTKVPGDLSVDIPAGDCYASLFGPSHQQLQRDTPPVYFRQFISPGVYTVEIAGRLGRGCTSVNMNGAVAALGRLLLGTIPQRGAVVRLRLSSADKK